MVSSPKAYRVVSCLKISLAVFTVYFLCTGVLFFAPGIYGLISLKYFYELSPLTNISVTPIILCGTGGLIIVFGLFGCLSIFKDSKRMLNCYGIFLIIVSALEITGGISAYIFMNGVQKSFEVGFTNALQSYNPREKNSIDQAQNELQCCGINSYRDWFTTPWANETRQCGGSNSSFTVPLTCCKHTTQKTEKENVESASRPFDNPCYCGNQDDKLINTVGCMSVLFGTSGQTLHYLLAAAFGMATVQLIGILFILCIYCKKRQIYSSRRRY